VPEPHVEAKSARRGKKTRQPKPQTVALPPSERFVWFMTALIISLVGTIVLEAIHIIVTGRLSTELFTVISGLIGSFTTAFLLGPEGRRKRMPKGKPGLLSKNVNCRNSSRRGFALRESLQN